MLFRKAFADRVPRTDAYGCGLGWGFALFIRRSLWEQAGGFDQRLPDYGNEMELCRRIAEEGYRLVWIRNSYIHHFGQQSYRGNGWRRRHPRA